MPGRRASSTSWTDANCNRTYHAELSQTRDPASQSTTLDLSLTSPLLSNRVLVCQRRDDMCHPSNHLPIETILDIELEAVSTNVRWVWKSTNKGLLLHTLRNALPKEIAPGIEGLEGYTRYFVAMSTQKKNRSRHVYPEEEDQP